MKVPANTTGRGAHRLHEVKDRRASGGARDFVLMPGTIAAGRAHVDYLTGKAITPQVSGSRLS